MEIEGCLKPFPRNVKVAADRWGSDVIRWHLALWVHSRVQHLGLHPSGSLAMQPPECLNWKSIHLCFLSYWLAWRLSARLLSQWHTAVTRQERAQEAAGSGEPRRRLCQPLPLLNSLLIPTCVGAELHSHRENKAPSSVCVDCVSALALGCRAMLQRTLGWWEWWWGESFPAIPESVTESRSR